MLLYVSSTFSRYSSFEAVCRLQNYITLAEIFFTVLLSFCPGSEAKLKKIDVQKLLRKSQHRHL